MVAVGQRARQRHRRARRDRGSRRGARERRGVVGRRLGGGGQRRGERLAGGRPEARRHVVAGARGERRAAVDGVRAERDVPEDLGVRVQERVGEAELRAAAGHRGRVDVGGEPRHQRRGGARAADLAPHAVPAAGHAHHVAGVGVGVEGDVGHLAAVDDGLTARRGRRVTGLDHAGAGLPAGHLELLRDATATPAAARGRGRAPGDLPVCAGRRGVEGRAADPGDRGIRRGIVDRRRGAAGRPGAVGRAVVAGRREDRQTRHRRQVELGVRGVHVARAHRGLASAPADRDDVDVGRVGRLGAVEHDPVDHRVEPGAVGRVVGVDVIEAGRRADRDLLVELHLDGAVGVARRSAHRDIAQRHGRAVALLVGRDRPGVVVRELDQGHRVALADVVLQHHRLDVVRRGRGELERLVAAVVVVHGRGRRAGGDQLDGRHHARCDRRLHQRVGVEPVDRRHTRGQRGRQGRGRGRRAEAHTGGPVGHELGAERRLRIGDRAGVRARQDAAAGRREAVALQVGRDSRDRGGGRREQLRELGVREARGGAAAGGEPVEQRGVARRERDVDRDRCRGGRGMQRRPRRRRGGARDGGHRCAQDGIGCGPLGHHHGEAQYRRQHAESSHQPSLVEKRERACRQGHTLTNSSAECGRHTSENCCAKWPRRR